MPLGWVAAAAAVGSTVEGAINASNQNDIANTQLGMSQTVFGEQQQYEGQLWNLINNPSSVTMLPGYEFQMQQGSDSVAREMASRGMLGSGNEAAALTQYGQGLASSFYGQQASLLAQLAGITSPTNANSAAQGASQANNNAFNQWGSVFSSLGYLGAMNSGAGSFTPYMGAPTSAGVGGVGTFGAM